MSDIVRREQTRKNRIVYRFLSLMWLLGGLGISYVLASLAEWRSFTLFLDRSLLDLLLTTFVCFVVITFLVRYVRRFALVNLWAVVAFLVILIGAIQIVVYSTVKLAFYPFFSLVFYMGTIGIISIWVRMIKKIQFLRLASVPFGITAEVEAVGHPQLEIIRLQSPEVAGLPEKINGVVVDTREPLSDKWVRFLAACRLDGLRIYQAEELLEGATGRISLSHLSQGIVDDFSGNMIYLRFKRALDIIVVVVLLPIFLLCTCVLAVAIKVETHGPIFFVQDRVGQGGNIFKMLKFRSMTSSSGSERSRFTIENDRRITRVGAFIRRYRLDEIPQLLNIFKGEMSLIGPRPEQPDFVKKFSEEIPFYAYRHTVKPGITGWAQVTLGYVGDEESTWNKLEYDLYYIKHQSFWLDMLIVMKTIKTVLTGFGAR